MTPRKTPIIVSLHSSSPVQVWKTCKVPTWLQWLKLTQLKCHAQYQWWALRFTVATRSIALLSASQQTHCTLLVYNIMRLWMSDCSFTQRIFNIHLSGCCCWSLLLLLVTALFSFCHVWGHVKLWPSRSTYCVHHATLYQFTVSFYS